MLFTCVDSFQQQARIQLCKQSSNTHIHKRWSYYCCITHLRFLSHQGFGGQTAEPSYLPVTRWCLHKHSGGGRGSCCLFFCWHLCVSEDLCLEAQICISFFFFFIRCLPLSPHKYLLHSVNSESLSKEWNRRWNSRSCFFF